MASAFDGLRAEVLGASLSVDGYEVAYPSNEQILLLLENKEITLVRELLGENWKAWRGEYGQKQDIQRFLSELWDAMGIEKAQADNTLAILGSDKHFRALEADLTAMGVPLGDLLRGSLSFRKLVTLTEALGPDSRLAAAFSDPLEHWSRTEYMLADVIDLLNYQLAFQAYIPAGVGHDKPIRPPKPSWPRPGSEKPKVEFTPTEDAKAFFGALSR